MSTRKPLTKLIGLVCCLSALDIVLSAIPNIPLLPSWAVLLKPSEGILLGSTGGMLAAFVGGIVSTIVWPYSAVLGLATWVPGVVGAFGAGMMLKRRWKPVAGVMLAILLAFLAHPWGRPVMLYANWDKAIALALVYPVYRFSNNRLNDRGSVKALMPAIGLIALIATEMDGATGNLIYLLEAGPIFGLSAQMLQAAFILYSFWGDALARLFVGVICALVLTPVLIAVEKANLLRWPLT